MTRPKERATRATTTDVHSSTDSADSTTVTGTRATRPRKDTPRAIRPQRAKRALRLGRERTGAGTAVGRDAARAETGCAVTGRAWPAPTVIDTVGLARAVVTRDEARNHKLATLARLFRSPVTPDHRALTDARATVDVLHALLERIGPLGVTSLEELAGYSSRVPETTRRKRHLAADLPHAPGVYVFVDGRGRPLYVGTSGDLKTRVRTYFTATERRTRMGEMVAIAESVTAVVCATALEARVRELRLIAEHNPPYNRRSRFPERAPWVKLTVEPFPRLSVVRAVLPDGATYLGPFGSRRQAELAVAGLHEAIPLRQCTSRLPRRPSASARACMLAEIGRCGAPCVGGQDVESYRHVAEAARTALTRDAGAVVSALLAGEHLSRDESAWAMDRMTTAEATAAGSSGCGTTWSARDHVASQASWARPVSTSTGGHW